MSCMHITEHGMGKSFEDPIERFIVAFKGRCNGNIRVNDLDAGKMTYDEYRDMVVGAVPEHLRKYAAEAVMYDIRELPMIDGMEELLKKLKNDGYHLYITSNLNTRHAKQMREHKIAKYFMHTHSTSNR